MAQAPRSGNSRPLLMLLDGNSLTYRAFFALPTDMATASGQVTNAVFGFTSMLVNLLKDHQPSSIAVAFDRAEPTFRHKMVTDYKAGREEAPDILRQQMGLVRQVLETLRVPMVDYAGFEADDVIATLSRRGVEDGSDVLIVTGDRDVYQLVSDPHVKVLYNRRGVSDYALYDEAGIKERTGVLPAQYIDYASLRGDPSDNLPGVPGVGEKTAAKLINNYGNLDGVFANVEAQTPKLRSNLTEHEAQARSNAAAIPLVSDVPLETELASLRIVPYDTEAAKQLFNFLEFRSLWDRLVEATGEQGAESATPQAEAQSFDVSVDEVSSAAELKKALDGIGKGEGPLSVAPAWEGAPGRSAIIGLAFGHLDYSAAWIDGSLLQDKAVIDVLSTHLAETTSKRLFNAHRAKELMRALARYGIDASALALDTAVAAYLVDPADTQYLLEDLALRHAQLEVRPPDAPAPGQLDLDGTAGGIKDNTAREAIAIAHVAEALAAALEARNLTELWNEMERPLVRVLARMEDIGIRVDVDYLGGLTKRLTEEAARLEGEIQEHAGEQFNVNSTLKLRTILFENLGLTPQKKTKTGYSTDAASLEKLRGQHPIIESLLRYREVEKLRSTYGESLLAEVQEDQRIHATFQQTVARTGRLSSDRPNLHNIPVRSDEGREFRRGFIPNDGWLFLIGDYNQIELRVIAHLAEDPGLIEAFETGADVHTTTAARVFDVADADVTRDQRSKAKMVSYGLAYGMEAYGLASRLGIPVPEAAQILEAYFQAFPSVRAYMDRTVEEARQKGYTETLFGRRRLIPELASTNFRIRQAGERQAMNAGIQGLAADIFKVALVRLDKELEAAAMASRIVLQVHDEIIVETAPGEETEAERLMVNAMKSAAMGLNPATGSTELRVPLEVNLSTGASWAEAKG